LNLQADRNKNNKTRKKKKKTDTWLNSPDLVAERHPAGANVVVLTVIVEFKGINELS
jgi:hypothetical protein